MIVLICLRANSSAEKGEVLHLSRKVSVGVENRADEIMLQLSSPPCRTRFCRAASLITAFLLMTSLRAP